MADPFSIAAGTISIVDVCVRLTKYIHDKKEALKKIGGEIQQLEDEIGSFQEINTSVGKSFQNWKNNSSEPPAVAARIELYWELVGKSLQSCETTLKRLEGILHEIHQGSGSTIVSKRDAFTKDSRKRARQEDLRLACGQLATCQRGLQILLHLIELENQGATSQAVTKLKDEFQKLREELRSQLWPSPPLQYSRSPPVNPLGDESETSGLHDLRKLNEAISSAAGVLSRTGNRHFDVPQPLSSVYTGRQSLLEELKNTFFPGTPEPTPLQRRFVVNGIGGSGKTQFCSKFAELNRQRFWGVFWIDMRSAESTKKTLSTIANIAEVEPNEASALHWLANLEERWLLIIDNADDPKLTLERYFPKGDRGYILITTRNLTFTSYGNVGRRFFVFEGLDEEEANDLLLLAAGQDSNADSSAIAKEITRALGYLVLAIINAGAAIRSRLCSFKNYLATYEGYWERVRRGRLSAIGVEDSKQADYMKIWASFELSYSKIKAQKTQSAVDAVQLLKVLAFFYCDNIRLDIFVKAVHNLKTEEEAAAKNDNHMGALDQAFSWSASWSKARTLIKHMILGILSWTNEPSPLPVFLWEAREHGRDDDFRLNAALSELIQTSLIIHRSSNDSYSLHPLVAEWARERPDASLTEHEFLAQQALAARSAAMILSASILLPPLGDTDKDEELRRDLLPHVHFVLTCQEAIQKKFHENQNSFWWSWPRSKTTMSRDRALIYAKFSLVYAQGGMWREAENLQLEVKDFLMQMLGLTYPNTRRIFQALASTKYHLSRLDEAAQLKEAVLDACITSLGRRHQETLLAMKSLGETRTSQGRFKDAKVLQEEALEGLRAIYGEENRAVFETMNDLGNTFAGMYHFDEARKYNTAAVDGLSRQEILGSSHLRTLGAMESLAALAPHIKGNFLNDAHAMMLEVLEQRRKKFRNKEHPLVLLAMAHLASIKRERGELSEAESLVRGGISIAQRNVGPDHIGTLYGQWILSTIMIQQKRYEEAEKLLQHTADRQITLTATRGDYHPDRIRSLISLSECYKLSNRLSKALDTCNEAIKGMENIGGTSHLLYQNALKERKLLETMQRKPVDMSPADLPPNLSPYKSKTATW